MQKKKFYKHGLFKGNNKWDYSIKRYSTLYKRSDDIRSEFWRDYNRILHCKAYRRLKNKTQVFFATTNDHICTRIEHVNHVASVSYTISRYLGLNTELTNAIAIGHDLGHTPFGHQGEEILNDISIKYLNEPFWHEKNSLLFVDKFETLEDTYGKQKNLSLTYAVRDGIISHCGEVNENSIFPRKNNMNLYDIERPNQYQPYTWEGCVVKISDKISFLGRDIEDALRLKILSLNQLRELKKILEKTINVHIRAINNTALMHNFIINLCKMSSPDDGIRFSKKYLLLINLIKEFNFKNIYKHPRLNYFNKYAELIINSIFEALVNLYHNNKTLDELYRYKKTYPFLVESFSDWLIKYSDIDNNLRKQNKYENTIIFNINSKEDYLRAIIEYISSMTDNYAIKVFNELIKF